MSDDYNSTDAVAADEDKANVVKVLGYISMWFSADMATWENLSTDDDPDDAGYTGFGDTFEKYNDRHSSSDFRDAFKFWYDSDNDLVEEDYGVQLRAYNYYYDNFMSIKAGEDAVYFKNVFNNETYFELMKFHSI